MPLSAYVARSGDDSTVVFAKNRLEAQRIAAGRLDLEPEDIEDCSPEPAFDQYAKSGYVPVLALLEQGWWLECGGCVRRVSLDEMLDSYSEWEMDLLYPTDPPLNILIHREQVFCCPECLSEWQASCAAWQAKRENAYAQAAEHFPGLSVVSYYSQATLEKPAFLVLQLPNAIGWRGRLAWEVGASMVNGPTLALEAFEEWKRLRRQLPYRNAP